MKTAWDYSELAAAYINRPNYAEEAITIISNITGLKEGDRVCDIGAGVAHLTLMLASRDLFIKAIEPNDSIERNW